ncbi:hypothetical protein ACTFQF_00275 [Aliivibrio fischeri]|uniref:hypothetical protein n=1 Tax=Aliivibrio fischeri TaxID=668 RepID=UPI0007C51922|nr:hypothetical protein [Aliivibrio fischeri]
MSKKLPSNVLECGVLNELEWVTDLSKLPFEEVAEPKSFFSLPVLFKVDETVYLGRYNIDTQTWENIISKEALTHSKNLTVEFCVVDTTQSYVNNIYDYLHDEEAFLLDHSKNTTKLFDVIQHNRLDNIEVKAIKGMTYAIAIYSAFIEHLNHRNQCITS